MKAIITVPIYKEVLDSAELISLQQLFKILGEHDICFIMPESSLFSITGFQAMQERFADKYFTSKAAYSELMTSEVFYRRFVSYDYVLIYQLDAFVFTNRLAEFCELGYDYIGAPVPFLDWPLLQHRVGNGGFSLRKIQSVLRLLLHRQEILAKARTEFSDRFYNYLLTTEDIFFAYSGNLPEYDFHLAPKAIAGDFSIEYDIKHCLYAGVQEHLPFGCHRWYAGMIDFWRPHIEAFGYDISALVEQGLAWGEGRRLGAYAYLLQRLARTSKTSIRRAIADFLPERDGYSIWGAGQLGMVMYTLLYRGGYEIYRIFDVKSRSYARMAGHEVEYPTVEALHRAGFLIVSVRRDRAICKQLEEWGFREGRDYCRMVSLEKAIAQGWYERMKKQ